MKVAYPGMFHPRATDPEPGMAMVKLSAVQRHHRSRISYACSLLALAGIATAMVVAARDPAHSSTELATPVPAPASEFPPTGQGPAGADLGTPSADPTWSQPMATTPGDQAPDGPGPSGSGRGSGDRSAPGPDEGDPRAGAGGGTAALADARHLGPAPSTPVARSVPSHPTFSDPTETLHRSLTWSGLFGLALSVTGLVMVSRRRRMW